MIQLTVVIAEVKYLVYINIDYIVTVLVDKYKNNVVITTKETFNVVESLDTIVTSIRNIRASERGS